MKRFCTRAGMTVILAAFLLIIAMAAVTVQSYAYTYNSDIDEGEATTLNWGDEYDAYAVTYIKIKPSKKGVITFTADFYCWVSLCNSKKKVISKGSDEYGDYLDPDNTNSFNHKVYYGVKKGTTYYLKLQNMPRRQNESGEYIGVLKYTTSKVAPSKCGTSKKKAVAIKKNKKVKGLFVAGNKKAQWYKITNKQKVTKISIAAPKINHQLKFKIYYQSAGKWYDATYTLARQTDYSKNTITATVNRKAKHTYYIKVYPEGKTSGNYTIKWK